jgi:hypothetical protein
MRFRFFSSGIFLLFLIILLKVKFELCFEIDLNSKRIVINSKRALTTTSSYEIEEIFLNVEF